MCAGDLIWTAATNKLKRKYLELTVDKRHTWRNQVEENAAQVKVCTAAYKAILRPDLQNKILRTTVGAP